jgi:hypothetical protein
MTVTWGQALARRLERHLLDPVGTGSVADVVERLGAVAAWPDTTADLAIGLRRAVARPGDVERALDAGDVLQAYAFRGARHLMTTTSAGRYLALRASGRQWELPSWQEAYGLTPDDWPAFREAVRDAVADEPLTRQELRAAVGRKRRFRAGADGLVSGSDTLLKSLMWQGDLCFGRPRDGQATLQALAHVPGWSGLPDLDDAGREAVLAHVATFGPVTPDDLHYWLGAGLSAGKRAIRGWLDDVADRLAEVDVEGATAFVPADEARSLERTTPSEVVRLLPAGDPWVMGVGTADRHVTPPARRALVTRGAHTVLAGGVVAGTWTLRKGVVGVTWFTESGRPDHDRLRAETDRLAATTANGLTLEVTVD